MHHTHDDDENDFVQRISQNRHQKCGISAEHKTYIVFNMEKITLPTSVLLQKENNVENVNNQAILQTCVSHVQKLNQEQTYNTI